MPDNGSRLPLPLGPVVEKDEFCFDTVSYIPEATSKLPPELLLALLNSKLLEWYFLLGSSNSKLNEYQFNNLPCPVFTANSIRDEPRVLKALEAALESDDVGSVWSVVADYHLCRPPLSRTLQALLVKLVQRICEVETNRGSVSKVARAKLAEGAQPYQDLIDRLLFISGIFAGRSHRYRRENGGARLTWHYAQRSMEEWGRVGRDARTVTLQLHQRFSGATLKKPKKHAGGG